MCLTGVRWGFWRVAVVVVVVLVVVVLVVVVLVVLVVVVLVVVVLVVVFVVDDDDDDDDDGSSAGLALQRASFRSPWFCDDIRFFLCLDCSLSCWPPTLGIAQTTPDEFGSNLRHASSSLYSCLPALALGGTDNACRRDLFSKKYIYTYMILLVHSSDGFVQTPAFCLVALRLLFSTHIDFSLYFSEKSIKTRIHHTLYISMSESETSAYKLVCSLPPTYLSLTITLLDLLIPHNRTPYR